MNCTKNGHVLLIISIIMHMDITITVTLLPVFGFPPVYMYICLLHSEFASNDFFQLINQHWLLHRKGLKMKQVIYHMLLTHLSDK